MKLSSEDIGTGSAASVSQLSFCFRTRVCGFRAKSSIAIPDTKVTLRLRRIDWGLCWRRTVAAGTLVVRADSSDIIGRSWTSFQTFSIFGPTPYAVAQAQEA